MNILQPKAKGTMLVTSLPIPQKPVDSTWGFFCGSEASREFTVNWLKENGCNAIVPLTNVGKEFSIFKDNIYGGKVDREKLALVTRWAKRVHDAGGYFVPCLFNDGDKDLVDQLYAHVRYVSLLELAIGEYMAGVIVWLEGNECYTTDFLRRFVAYLKSNVTGKPIGAHGVYSRERDPGNLDFWANEFYWNPPEGESHSTEEAVNEGRRVIAESGLPVLFLEDCWNPGSPMSRAHARALAALPGCVGVPSPL